MPHLLAVDLAATETSALRQLACTACLYLMARGETGTCHDLASDLRRQWSDRLGDDHEHVWEMAHYLAWALRVMGRNAEARDLTAGHPGPQPPGLGRGPPQHPGLRQPTR